MVFIGGWRSRRRRFPPQDDPYAAPYGPNYPPNYPPGYGPGYGRRFGYRRGYGGGGGSCLRDMFLLEGGCCLAELIGCGTQFVLLAPSLLGRTLARSTRADAALPNEGLRPRTVRLLLHAIEAYQVQISPRRRPCCRYTPTCSHYAAQALRTHGLARGLWLTTRRLVRCRPGARGGSDPVPR